MNENSLPEKQVTEDSIPSRRGFVKSLLFALPAVSSNVSTGILGAVFGLGNLVPDATGDVIDAVTSGDAVIDAIDVNKIPFETGEITFVGIAHVPKRVEDISQAILGKLNGEKYDKVFIELNLDKFLPEELRGRAENIDRSQGALGVIFGMSIINTILCHKMRIKSTETTMIKRRLLVMYILTLYNFTTPIDLFLNVFRMLGINNVPPIGGYITTGRSLLMLLKCLDAAKQGKKVLYLCGKLHSDEAKVLLENPQLFEILREVIPRLYGPIHTIGE